eukprot:7866677-Pyramimonas_sp.AAC.1
MSMFPPCAGPSYLVAPHSLLSPLKTVQGNPEWAKKKSNRPSQGPQEKPKKTMGGLQKSHRRPPGGPT